MPHIRHHPEWLVNYEQQKSVKEIGEYLQKVGSLLAEKGKVVLGSQKVEVQPSNPSYVIVRYERKPKGEMCLKFEIEWNTQHTMAPEAELIIE